MAATIIWIGGLFYFGAILSPVLSKSSLLMENPWFLESIFKRFNPLAWLSLAILVLTGLLQMTTNPNYQGLFEIESTWAQAILIKHIAIIAMVALASIQTWIVQPRLSRLLLVQAKSQELPTEEYSTLVRRTLYLSRFNLILGLVVLLLTAIARTA